MYCPNCGKTVDKKLKYCNGCGERLSRAAETDGSPARILPFILAALCMVVLFGLGILVGLVAVLLGSGVKTDMVFGVIIAWLLAIFGICFSLARQATKVIDFRLRSSNAERETHVQRGLPPLTTAQLNEFREPAMSVTEHTTRTLADP